MKKLMFCALAATIANAQAFEMSDLKPYYGVDFSVDHTRYDKDKVGIANLNKWNGVAGFNLGADINEFFGVEIGFYQLILTKDKDTSTGTSRPSVFGAIEAGEDDSIYKIKLRSRGIKLNLTGSYPLLENTKLLGMIGLSWENNKLEIRKVYLAGAQPNGTTAQPHLTGKVRPMVTASAGAKWSFNTSSGLRAFITWQNRSSLRDLKGTITATRTGSSAFKDSLRYTVGIYTYI